MNNIKLACFDLDDTLIRHAHSVMIPCIINGQEEAHSLIQQAEENGTLDYITADYKRAELLVGLEKEKLREDFLKHVKPLLHIEETLTQLKRQGVKCLLITVGPIQVAEVVSELWGFDAYFGTEYETVEGVFTGRINRYISAEEKLSCLQAYCEAQGISLMDCVSIGDGSTDIPVFEACGGSIAINAKDSVKAAATHWVDTDDLLDVLEWI